MVTGNDKKTTSVRVIRPGVMAVVVFCVMLSAPHRTDAANPIARVSNKSAFAIQLVDVNQELLEFLRKSVRFIDEKDYKSAISMLQTLIRRKDSGFIVEANGRRYSSLWFKANEVLAAMPPEGLKQYHDLYDSTAGYLFKKAVSQCDTEAMRRVAHEYLNTPYGHRALEALGTHYFDRGQYNRAAKYWSKSVKMSPKGPSRAVLLAKTAVAYHYCGDLLSAERLAGQLKSEYPRASAVLGGKKQNLVRFVSRILATKVSTLSCGGNDSPAWSGIGGKPREINSQTSDYTAIKMKWCHGDQPIGPHLTPDKLIALREKFFNWRGCGGLYKQLFASLKSGHVLMEFKVGRRIRVRFIAPPMVHPVLVGGKVICRTHDALVVYDLFTGRKIWDTSDKFPLYKRIKGINVAIRNFNPYIGSTIKIGDKGWHGLTVAEGKVFALGNFCPMFGNMQRYRFIAPEDRNGLFGNTSTLAAFSIGKANEGGKLLWKIGYGAKSGEKFTGGCKFLSAPTWYRGRLYVLASQSQHFYLLCLNASDGSLVWKTMISNLPPVDIRYGTQFWYVMERGSSPVISDGRVFAATGACVIGAFDAETGQGLWAYQYTNPTFRKGSIFRCSSSREAVTNPINPLIVSGKSVIFLPPDYGKVIALSTDRGSLLWETDRSKQRNLSVIDPGRILISAPGLMVLSTRDGKLGWSTKGDKKIVGRPIVTSREILASGPGLLYRLDLTRLQKNTNGKLQSIPLNKSKYLLGNLVGAGGKFITANSAGICVYFVAGSR